jgi:Acyltransferase
MKAGARVCCRYHGPRPAARENAVWVCNHTSMIDYIILTAYSPFAVIMQLHPGWVSTVKPYCNFELVSRDWRLVTCKQPVQLKAAVMDSTTPSHGQSSDFSAAVQVGFVQTAVLGCLGCLWFNRNEVGRAL